MDLSFERRLSLLDGHDIRYKFLAFKLFFFLYQGRNPFKISFATPLPDNVLSGVAEFEGVGTVTLEKDNPFTLSGCVPGN